MKKKNISIAFVIHTFLPESYGGAEKQLAKLTSNLKYKNINSIILAPKFNKETPSESYEENIYIKRFKLNNLPSLGGRNIFSFIVWSIKLIYWLIRNSDKFDIIQIIHGRLHSVPAIFAGKILKKPVIVKVGTGGEHFDVNAVNYKKIIGPFFSKYILKNVDGWIANSDLIISNLKSHNIKNQFIHKIYNGIEIKNIRVNEFKKNKTFIVIGRLDEKKYCDQIINAFSKLPENLNVKLIFLGDGDKLKSLKKLTSKLKQSHRIIFKGAINNVDHQIISSDFYISNSISEGMSNSLLETMALGVPPITSNVSGVEEMVINNKNGFIFEPKNETDLYEKLVKAINCSEESYINMSRLASEHLFKNFAMGLISKKYIELYEYIIKNN
jgi:glycosyltransferase involved in cell wall biosynthesis